MLHRPLDPPIKSAGDEERVPAGDAHFFVIRRESGESSREARRARRLGMLPMPLDPPAEPAGDDWGFATGGDNFPKASFAGLTGEPIWPA